jgi:hypothetical protein
MIYTTWFLKNVIPLVFKYEIIHLKNCALGFEAFIRLGESTLHPPKIVVTKTNFLHLVLLGTCGHHILDYFCPFQVYCINLKAKLVYLKRNSNKHLQT